MRVTSYFTGGKGNYMISAMEDTGTMQSLTFLGSAGRIDPQRVLVLRTVSNYDREAPGMTAAQSLGAMGMRQYSAFGQALETAEQVGDRGGPLPSDALGGMREADTGFMR